MRIESFPSAVFVKILGFFLHMMETHLLLQPSAWEAAKHRAGKAGGPTTALQRKMSSITMLLNISKDLSSLQAPLL